MRTIPITYIVHTNRLYNRIFEIEDGDVGININQEYSACRRAYDDYLDKMFLDDKETSRAYDQLLNQCIIKPGTYGELCDFIRSRGYEVLSMSNSTKPLIKECERKCLEEWREWRKTKKMKIT